MGVRSSEKPGVRVPAASSAWEALYDVDPYTATFEGIPTAAIFAIGQRMATTKGYNNEHGFIVKRRKRKGESRPSDPAVNPRPFSAKSAAEEYQRIYHWMYPTSETYIEQV